MLASDSPGLHQISYGNGIQVDRRGRGERTSRNVKLKFQSGIATSITGSCNDGLFAPQGILSIHLLDVKQGVREIKAR